MADESKKAESKAQAAGLRMNVAVYNAGAVVKRLPTRTINDEQATELQAVLGKLRKGGKEDSTFVIVDRAGTIVWEEWRQLTDEQITELFIG